MLDGQRRRSAGLVRDTGEVFGALTQDEGQLHNLVVNAGDTFDATSRQQEALAETFRIFPTFLDESKATFQRLERFSKDTDPLVQDLRPAMRDLTPTLRDVRAPGARPAQPLRQPRPADHGVEDGPARAARHADRRPSRCSASCSPSSSSSTRSCSGSSTTS